jgi:hypothetical protein
MRNSAIVSLDMTAAMVLKNVKEKSYHRLPMITVRAINQEVLSSWD